jgi:hypothetical protein
MQRALSEREIFVSRDDGRQRALIEVKFLRQNGEAVLSQEQWNAVADLEIALASASASAPIVDRGRLWLSRFQGRP